MATQNENRDGLTGLWRREYAFEKLEAAVEAGVRVALMFIDIDRMKSVNDVYGHDFGDQKLKEIAREIETASGRNSLVSRFGGDEFIVVLPGTSLEGARHVAETIRAQRNSMLIKLDEKEVETLTLSIGIAHFPTHVTSAQNLLEAADLALLKAKGEGKQGGRWRDGTPYTGRNRVMAIGDFLDDFPEESARFLR